MGQSGHHRFYSFSWVVPMKTRVAQVEPKRVHQVLGQRAVVLNPASAAFAALPVDAAA